jgi:hypothetical protein
MQTKCWSSGQLGLFMGLVLFIGLTFSLLVSSKTPADPAPARPAPAAAAPASPRVAADLAVPRPVVNRAERVAPVPGQLAEPFTFPPDPGGKLLRDQLLPPVAVPIAAVPFVDRPRPWARLKLEHVPGRPDAAANPAPAPIVLAAEKPRGFSHRPALDLPPLASTPAPERPAAPELYAGPKPPAVTSDPARPTPLPLLARPTVEKPTVTTDPTRDPSRQGIIKELSLLRDQPAPFTRFDIPDPFELADTVRFPAPPEADLPAVSTARPAPPPMPVKP